MKHELKQLCMALLVCTCGAGSLTAQLCWSARAEQEASQHKITQLIQTALWKRN